MDDRVKIAMDAFVEFTRHVTSHAFAHTQEGDHSTGWWIGLAFAHIPYLLILLFLLLGYYERIGTYSCQLSPFP